MTLAQAALSNAADLLADARVLADAGRFPRAYVVATLACEELGKQQRCLRAVWLPCTAKGFWNSFASHTDKLSHAHALTMLGRRDPATKSTPRRIAIDLINGSAESVYG